VGRVGNLAGTARVCDVRHAAWRRRAVRWPRRSLAHAPVGAESRARARPRSRATARGAQRRPRHCHLGGRRPGRATAGHCHLGGRSHSRQAGKSTRFATSRACIMRMRRAFRAGRQSEHRSAGTAPSAGADWSHLCAGREFGTQIAGKGQPDGQTLSKLCARRECGAETSIRSDRLVRAARMRSGDRHPQRPSVRPPASYGGSSARRWRMRTPRSRASTTTRSTRHAGGSWIPSRAPCCLSAPAAR